MKVFQDIISKLKSTEKHKSSFGYFCMKKHGSFPKERFSFFNSSMGIFDSRTPPSRAYATGYGVGLKDENEMEWLNFHFFNFLN